MFEPNYMCPISLLSQNTKITGNILLANRIGEIAKESIAANEDLYEAQDNIKSLLINNLGNNWFEKNGAAVNFIIENEYANLERSRLPAFDMRAYEQDMRSSVLY